MIAVRASLLAVVAAGALTACTTSGGTGAAAPSTAARTVTGTRTVTASGASTAPVVTAPTTAAPATSCPLLPEQQAADRVGMRLERIETLRSSGRMVGCRFYALQGSPLHASEHLPGPRQPAVEITTTSYTSPAAAHNAFVVYARSGSGVQRAAIAPGNTGLCFRTDFYARDEGRDWACSFSVGAVMVLVRTVVTSPAFDAVQVSRAVARHV